MIRLKRCKVFLFLLAREVEKSVKVAGELESEEREIERRFWFKLGRKFTQVQHALKTNEHVRSCGKSS